MWAAHLYGELQFVAQPFVRMHDYFRETIDIVFS